MQTLTLHVRIPQKGTGKGGDIQMHQSKEDATVSEFFVKLMEYNEIRNSKGGSLDGYGYALYHCRKGCFIPEEQTFAQFGTRDGDQLECRSIKDRDKLNVTFNGVSLSLLVDFNDRLRKIIPSLITSFRLGEKDDYCFRKLKEIEDKMKASKFLNANLSLREQGIKSDGSILLLPLQSFMEKTIDEVMPKTREGWMTKTSQKGEAKMTGMKKRWCVLKDNFLFYFPSNKSGSKPNGVLDLEYASISREGLNIKLDIGPEFSFVNQNRLYNFVGEAERDVAEWFLALKHHCSNGDLHRVFGISLEKLFNRRTDIFNVLVSCINYLDEKGLNVKGLFGALPSMVAVNNLKERFDQGENVDLNDCSDPVIISALLKLYLRDLPEPLLTYALYDSFISIADSSDQSRLKDLILALPIPNQIVLQILIFFLGRVLDHKAKNGVDISNLVYAFAPIFLKRNDENVDLMMRELPKIQTVVKLIIENRTRLEFKEPSEKRRFHLNLKTKSFACAQYDYKSAGQKNARGETDLSFMKGDIVEILDERPGNSWMKVSLNNEEGLVPSNYVMKTDPPGKIEIYIKKKKKERSSKAGKDSRKEEKSFKKKKESSKVSRKSLDTDSESAVTGLDNTNETSSSPTDSSVSSVNSSNSTSTTSVKDVPASSIQVENLPLPIMNIPPPPDALPVNIENLSSSLEIAASVALPPPPPDPVYQNVHSDPEEWKQKYETGVRIRKKLESDLAEARLIISNYEKKYGPL